MRYYDKTIILAPDLIFPYWLKALTYWAWTGTTEETRETLEMMQAPLDNDLAHWYWFWQEIYEGKYQAAINRLSSFPSEWVRTLMFERPTSLLLAYAYELLNESDLVHNAYDSARILLETEIETRKSEPRIHVALGFTYAGLGRTEDAVQEGK
jgi:hypothetical protein